MRSRIMIKNTLIFITKLGWSIFFRFGEKNIALALVIEKSSAFVRCEIMNGIKCEENKGCEKRESINLLLDKKPKMPAFNASKPFSNHENCDIKKSLNAFILPHALNISISTAEHHTHLYAPNTSSLRTRGMATWQRRQRYNDVSAEKWWKFNFNFALAL